MFRLLVALFITVPLLEIYLLLKVGSHIGALPTIALILFTAVLGAFLLRLQGLMTLARIRQSMDHGELPALSLIEGLILLIGGALLLTPGFFTDALGFLCLIPSLRRRLATGLLSRYFTIQARSKRDQPVVIEGEFHEEQPSSQDRHDGLDS